MPGARQTILGVGKVKNRAPAPIQISAEQILREARERQEAEPKSITHKITDKEELNAYRSKKRKSFEDSIRMQRHHIGNWLKYARWEELQGCIDRARSVFERALEVDPHNTTIWYKYVEMEQKNKNINMARNLWNRAIELLPRVDQLWYKYAYMEEILGNINGAREIYQRWMKWNPEDNAWLTFIHFEIRYHNIDNARKIYVEYVQSKGTLNSYLQYAKWEEKQGEIPTSRQVYEKVIEEFPDYELEPSFYIKFAKFEIRCKEYERARAIFKFALEKFSKDKQSELYQEFTVFEKRFGDVSGIEDIILNKRRDQYKSLIENDQFNYDIWFDLLRLEESAGNVDQIRDTYELALSKIPPYEEKRFWRRYIYIWINYALYEEIEAENIGRTREIYKQCINIIPHKKFTFSKMWILYAKFEIRQRNLDRARNILGQSLGMSPKSRTYKAYIQLELTLGNIDRVRILYNKYIQFNPQSVYTWSKYAELESSLQEIERARAIYDLAINQPILDIPEFIWKKYIDFEISLNEDDKVRELFRKLLNKVHHIKVYLTFIQFEQNQNGFERARELFKEANQYYKDNDLREERALILKSWKQFEETQGNENQISYINNLLPTKTKKTRPVYDDEGNEIDTEEYYDYVFPDEIGIQSSNQKLLELAQKWKKLKGEN